MIVRDESETIGRLVDSVRDLVDRWTIVDTGSVDGTPELVERLLGDLPGTLHRRPWVDFGRNRSELMALARGSADYLLLLDADMTLRRNGPLPPLTADAYALRTDGELDYANPRLVRGDLAWRYEGATHEYLTRDGHVAPELLEALTVVHFADGGARSDKFERDQRLLERELERRPDDPRTLFYLAQTVRDLGDRERAAALYERRVAVGGWWEERFYAAYQAGLLRALEDPVAGARWLLSACQLAPHRAEPLCDLARIGREQGWHATAYRAAARGMALGYPERDVLFVHRDVYEWRLRFERSVAAWWVGRPAESLELTEALLAEDVLPPAYAESARGNREIALRTLHERGEPVTAAVPARPVADAAETDPVADAAETERVAAARAATAAERAVPADGESLLEQLAPSVRIGELSLDVEPDWPCCNPSIAADGDGFRMVVRTVNFALEEDRYRLFDDDGAVRTLNYLVRLDGALEVVSTAPLTDRADGPPRGATDVLGYEDCRLVRHGGRWHALATVVDRSVEPRPRMALLSLDEARIERVALLSDDGAVEKNWVPFAGDGDGPLRLLYSADPTVVVDCAPDAGTLTRPLPDGVAWREGLRGGSQGVPVDDGHLFVVHETLPGPVFGRRYVHRLALVRGERLAALSRRFTFTGEPVEYCAGLAPLGCDRFVLSFGVWDRVAALAVVAADELLGLLEPLAELSGRE
jgi:hypothetical protein